MLQWIVDYTGFVIFYPPVSVLVSLATMTSVELSHSVLSQRIIVSFVHLT